MRLAVLFVLIQLASLVLTVLGVPIIGALALCRAWRVDSAGRYHWPAPFWIFDNQEDGICAAWYWAPIDRWHSFKWSALRNSANNLRYVPGVSLPGRPLWRRTWGAKPGGWYVQAGWNHSGFPVLSAGRNTATY